MEEGMSNEDDMTPFTIYCDHNHKREDVVRLMHDYNPGGVAGATVGEHNWATLDRGSRTLKKGTDPYDDGWVDSSYMVVTADGSEVRLPEDTESEEYEAFAAKIRAGEYRQRMVWVFSCRGRGGRCTTNLQIRREDLNEIVTRLSLAGKHEATLAFLNAARDRLG